MYLWKAGLGMRTGRLRHQSIVGKPLYLLFLSEGVGHPYGNYLFFHLALQSGSGQSGVQSMLGYSLSPKIKVFDFTSWLGFPSEIGKLDTAGRERGYG